MTAIVIVLVVFTLALGLAIGLLVGSRVLRADRAPGQAAGQVEATVAATRQAVAPVSDSLSRFEQRLRELEHEQVSARSALRAQLESVQRSGDDLRREAANLAGALRKPQTRGRWGELHLQRTVELAGLADRVDFDTQFTVAGGDGALRPDMVVHLAGGKHVVVDAKVPLAAFLEASDADTPDDRAQLLARHARHVRTHVDTLASKRYWSRLPSTPEFVVLFLPGDAFLAAALEGDPELLDYAFAHQVVPATPTTLVALLRTVAVAWRQEALAGNAREVFDLAREVYERLGTFAGHLSKLGRALDSSVSAYNAAVGSLETRVLTSARRLSAMNVVSTDLPTVPPSTSGVRRLSARELLDAELAQVSPPADDIDDLADDPHAAGLEHHPRGRDARAG